MVIFVLYMNFGFLRDDKRDLTGMKGTRWEEIRFIEGFPHVHIHSLFQCWIGGATEVGDYPAVNATDFLPRGVDGYGWMDGYG
mmetsp:Transcript_4592/g.8445  ORF Transcript_4592/g.8445 Transcript_4592/m.8445 type:complete len:83 (-) Transcript_4592:234-482(-)